jgi:hypothetical protein
MLDQKINAKHHPDWLDKGCDEDARQTWIDAQTDNLMCDADTIRDAIAELPDAELEYIGSRAVDALNFNSPHSHEACERMGRKIGAALYVYAKEIAERQWEMLNG